MRQLSALLVALVLAASPTLASADEPTEAAASVEVATQTETFGPIDVRLTLAGYRVRLDHRQVEALIEMSDYAEMAAVWAESDIVGHIVWLARAQLAAFCALGEHRGVEVSGGWRDIPSVLPR